LKNSFVNEKERHILALLGLRLLVLMANRGAELNREPQIVETLESLMEFVRYKFEEEERVMRWG
jgi:hemerythrin